MGATRDLYEEAIRLYNAGDIEGFANAHAEDAVLVTPRATARGRAAIREYWDRQRVAFPDYTLTLDVIVEQGDTVATEWTWTGTNTGPIVRHDGNQGPPSNKRLEHRGMELARLHDGKIVEYHMYWDSTAIAVQLGLLGERAIN